MIKKTKIILMILSFIITSAMFSTPAAASPVLSMSIEEIVAILALNKITIIPKQNKRIKKRYTSTLTVTASAYTSHANQTDSTPNIAAWGDRLSPGMKVIAVSRDLLHDYGLKHNQKIKIKGLKGYYRVLDKMNKRWTKRIDIYMGYDLKEAFKWGKKKVVIEW